MGRARGIFECLCGLEESEAEKADAEDGRKALELAGREAAQVALLHPGTGFNWSRWV